MDYKLLLQIMMKWSLDNKDYETTYYLYTELGIGIPVKYIYKFPVKTSFSNATSFLNNSDVIHTSDKYLRKLLEKFRISKYIRLEEWKGYYGYRLSVSTSFISFT